MSRGLAALLAALLILTGAMGLKTVVAAHSNSALWLANGPDPYPPNPPVLANGPDPYPPNPPVLANGPDPYPPNPPALANGPDPYPQPKQPLPPAR